MTDKEYEDYMEEVMQARRHIKRFGNYSISPWVVKKYGFLKVKDDFEMRFGKEYQVRAVYIDKYKYYILEKRRNEIHHTTT